MAYWNNITTKLTPVTTQLGDGINTAVPSRDIKDSQASDMLNLDSHNYPALSVRPGFIPVGSSHTGDDNLLFSYKNDILCKIVNGNIYAYIENEWEYKGQLPFTPSAKMDYTNFMDNIYIATEDNKVVEIDVENDWDINTLSDAPEAKGITTHANRLYTIYDNILHYSGLRKPDDWNTVDESGKIQIDTTDGEKLTAVTTFSSHVVVFSPHGIYELYGTGPYNYEVVTISNEIGCISNSSVVELKQQLYFLGVDGIYVYNGGTAPYKISWAVEKIINRINKDAVEKSCATTDGRRYYIAIPIDDADYPNLVLVYDTEISEWYVQNYGEVSQFLQFYDIIYYMNNGQVYQMDIDNSDNISWYWISKPFAEGDTAKRVNWYRLYLIVDLPEQSTLSIYLSTQYEGDNDWQKLVDITASTNLERHKIIIPLGMAYDVDWVRIKLQGVGPCKVHEMQRFLRIKPW